MFYYDCKTHVLNLMLSTCFKVALTKVQIVLVILKKSPNFQTDLDLVFFRTPLAHSAASLNFSDF